MTKEQIEHILRVACNIAIPKTILFFCANALLFWVKESDMKELFQSSGEISRELDIDVFEENKNDLIDGAIGELSLFNKTFGYYAHGVSSEACLLPSDWQKRAKNNHYVFAENISPVKIIIPHPHDLAVSKLLAGREKDLIFCKKVLQLFPISKEVFTERVNNAAKMGSIELSETVIRSFMGKLSLFFRSESGESSAFKYRDESVD